MIQREQLMQELVHDPYKVIGKPPEPSTCTDCGASFRDGRWTWTAAQPGSGHAICPACKRIREKLPAGFVTLRGEFFGEHRDEVLSRVRHCEEAEKRDHPLQRIMAIQANGEGMLVTTTDPHLARRIGDALHKAFKGKLEFHYNKGEDLLRVTWQR